MDETLSIREITNAYLLYNGLTVSYMSRATRIPNSTLRDWLNGKINISTKNLSKVKQFLKGDFLLDVSTIINELLLQKEIAADENRTDWQRSWQAYKDLKWEIQRITESIDIKGILEKMDVEVKDWTPTFEELKKGGKGWIDSRKLYQ